MGMKTVAIIGALDEEVALIAKSLTHVTHTAKGSLDIVSGTVDSFGSDVIKVAATVGGMGLVNAAATTQLLIDEIAPDAVIFSGIAGNLNTHLHINDVVLGGSVDGLRIVESGLAAGDRVVVNGMKKIFFPGAPLQPVSVPMEAPNTVVEAPAPGAQAGGM